ncbi:TPM domain-containing protein [Burkholderia thailandensis]|uniref:Lipoprotein, putative n=1 Tax=Burkholderia thailandensis (strain ATCC 700388 / DSM 13276 / CCUG 48851 / CIP 106301 / E264) TaxID=271848 RepID=Q2T1V6_BURTA|nr:YgcG family protein [Burkholderia thailandensis]ABC39192.1 lipoprotein, putative [Burkholderia thailandensis E264]AHI72248.1 repair family protein [Burkholderia thailandensis 2002721723]AHI79877.1 repair family protein [Burkholderia thailandensis E444]AIC88696.1 repair family protein [Burkholderia thailandensis USAMRU Malaysia \
MKNLLRAACVAILTFLSLGGGVCRAEQPVPPLAARVTDETGTLTAAERATLEQSLKDFEARKGSQIAVLIVPTTQPETIEQYSIRVVEQWKLGRANVDDGALLIVAKNDRTLRIEVGYGLEGVLTDATSHRIIDEIIVPGFRRGDFYGGISAGVGSMMRVIEGEPLPPPRARRGDEGGLGRLLPLLFVMTIVAGGVLRAILGRLAGSVVTGGVVGFVAWMLSGALFVAFAAAAVALFFTLLGGGVGARVGGPFIGGRGGGWGGGSDGFRGGGGGFGGGGASGRW